jgi:hypothetical protein
LKLESGLGAKTIVLALSYFKRNLEARPFYPFTRLWGGLFCRLIAE